MHLDFDAARRERERATHEPLTFTLGGETFTCLDSAPIGIFVDAIDDIERGWSNRAYMNFVLGAVLEADEQRLRAVLRRKPVPATGESTAIPAVDPADIEDVFSALVDAYTGRRPTVRPSDSPDGPPTTGATSNGVSEQEPEAATPSE